MMTPSAISVCCAASLCAAVWGTGARAESIETFTEPTGPTGGGAPVALAQPSLVLTPVITVAGTFNGTLGEIKWLPYTFAPRGSLEANGQLLQISEFSSLFALMGTTYGGDGRTTFALPDLRGRAVIGTGTGAGLSAQTRGQTGGAATISLSEANLTPHGHTTGDGVGTSTTGGGQPFDIRQPTLALDYEIVMQGVFPPLDLTAPGLQAGSFGDESLLATVKIDATGDGTGGIPGDNDSLPTDGRVVPINQNQAMFALLGTNFGGDGRTTFGLPDTQGRLVVGSQSGFAGPGLPSVALGEKFGSETAVMGSGLPSHIHTDPDPDIDFTGATGAGQPIQNTQPSLGLNYMIALQGIYPSRDLMAPVVTDVLSGSGAPLTSTGEPFIGEIALFAGNFAPRGWALANGQILSISQNSALFSLLGTTFGGDGRTTFALPDLRGRVPIGRGVGPLGSLQLGTRLGTPDTVLSVAQMPGHTHDITRPVPIPVPATGLLLAGALAGLGLARRRGARAQAVAG